MCCTGGGAMKFEADFEKVCAAPELPVLTAAGAWVHAAQGGRAVVPGGWHQLPAAPLPRRAVPRGPQDLHVRVPACLPSQCAAGARAHSCGRTAPTCSRTCCSTLAGAACISVSPALTCGSGVSIIHVDSDGKHTRVGGSALGGATFLGLACMLARVDNFDQGAMMSSAGTHDRSSDGACADGRCGECRPAGA